LRSIAARASAATGYHKGSPSIENDSPFQDKTEAACARLDVSRLGFGKAGKDRGPARHDMLGIVGRKIAMRTFEQVGEEEIGPNASQPRMSETISLCHPHGTERTILRRVLSRDLDCD
jgi:hypothetical protein